jgi:hypothetical protein
MSIIYYRGYLSEKFVTDLSPMHGSRLLNSTTLLSENGVSGASVNVVKR